MPRIEICQECGARFQEHASYFFPSKNLNCDIIRDASQLLSPLYPNFHRIQSIIRYIPPNAEDASVKCDKGEKKGSLRTLHNLASSKSIRGLIMDAARSRWSVPTVGLNTGLCQSRPTRKVADRYLDQL